MTTNAWIFLAASWSVIALATLYCFGKLLNSKQALGHHDDEPPPML